MLLGRRLEFLTWAATGSRTKPDHLSHLERLAPLAIRDHLPHPEAQLVPKHFLEQNEIGLKFLGCRVSICYHWAPFAATEFGLSFGLRHQRVRIKGDVIEIQKRRGRSGCFSRFTCLSCLTCRTYRACLTKRTFMNWFPVLQQIRTSILLSGSN